MPTLTSDVAKDTRLILLDPARAVVAYVTDFRNLSLEVGLYEQATLTVEVHKDSKACTTEYSSVSAIDDDWEEWSLDFYYRGARVFSGPVQIVQKDRPDYAENAFVTLVAESWFPALMRRRLVLTDDNSSFTHTDSWDDIFRELVGTNCVAGRVVEPSAGAQRQAYPHSDREDFGSFTVTVQTDTGTAESATYITDMGTNLLDTLIEVCASSTTSDAHYLWPTVTETSAGTFQIGCVVGRSGGSRAIGADLSSSIIFASSLGNLAQFAKELDRTPLANTFMCTADGAGVAQRIRYKSDSASKTAMGIYEQMVNLAQGGTDAECDQEAARQIAALKDAWTTWTISVLESDNLEWPADFDVTDTITAYDHVYEETVQRMIVGVKLEIQAPGPSKLSLVFGHMPRNEGRERGRSGGGGGGGRGGGGRPRGKSGDPGSDERKKWQTWRSQEGADMLADEPDDVAGAVGEGAAGVMLRNVTKGVDPGTGDGTEEKQLVYILGTYTPAAISADGYVEVRLDDGTVGRLLCDKQIAGVPSLTPDDYGSV